MANNETVRLALDTYRNRVQNYAQNDSQEVLRNELIELNGGSTKLDYRAIRDGQCKGLFSVIEQVLQKINEESYASNPLFEALVDYRNTGLGDQNEFIVPDRSLFLVSEVADGTQGLRRQRISGERTFSVTPTYKGVRIFEELSRVLSGRIDFNELIDRVSRSMNYRIYTDILNVLGGLGEADLGAEYINATGTYTEQELLELIDHVEADTGLPAIVYGTRNALSKVTIDAVAAGAEAAKTDKYTGWHYGTFHGAPMVSFPNAHKPGTSEFVLNNDRIYVYAGGEKPIKFVNEGDAIIIPGNPQDNADLTQEFLYMEKYGVAAAVVDKMGVYDIA